MNHTQRAIELAIEEGFGGETANQGKTKDKMYNEFVEFCTENWQSTILDPLFWQALGKALRWEDECDKCGTIQSVINSEIAEYGESVCKIHNGFGKKHIMFFFWKAQWHRFIDALASGQTPDDFFAVILPADK